jgi:hypothetical protein
MLLPPDVDQLSRVISEATAPAFVLTAVAGFVSVLRTQLISVVERIRSLNEVSDSDDSRAHLKSDLPRLRKRAALLNSATRLALASGMCTSLLLIVGFGCAFLRLQHIYGAAGLFLLAVALLGAALFKFGQEAASGRGEADHYR